MDDREESVILVDSNDKKLGLMPKLQAHKEGRLHRALSVFIFNPKGLVLLQKRASSKYHTGGLWSNTCCSHPRDGESASAAAHRRLKEEMGFDCELEEAFSFTYKVELGGIYEHEFDHVFVGVCEANPKPDPKEVESWEWADPKRLESEIEAHPEKYTHWMKEALVRASEFAKSM